MKSTVDYFDIKVGDPVQIIEFVPTPKGCADYYKVVKPFSTKIHYLFRPELEE